MTKDEVNSTVEEINRKTAEFLQDDLLLSIGEHLLSFKSDGETLVSASIIMREVINLYIESHLRVVYFENCDDIEDAKKGIYKAIQIYAGDILDAYQLPDVKLN